MSYELHFDVIQVLQTAMSKYMRFVQYSTDILGKLLHLYNFKLNCVEIRYSSLK